MNELCPCGLNKPYENCCGLYIENDIPAPTPEALMRSRYSAYVFAKVAYIAQTMKDEPLRQFKPEDVVKWLADVKWQGLKVIQQRVKSDKLGFVSFEAKYLYQGNQESICEKSEFHKIGDRWFYVGGKSLNPNTKW
ncbi:MAG: SEC-C domain-containing protein [Gammaproteobacteria bacterium]|jgi:SEC-C motif-containing protein|nr:SEC-C domain-containing protein [Gammaproteobacteria bacterium]